MPLADMMDQISGRVWKGEILWVFLLMLTIVIHADYMWVQILADFGNSAFSGYSF